MVFAYIYVKIDSFDKLFVNQDEIDIYDNENSKNFYYIMYRTLAPAAQEILFNLYLVDREFG
jgi:hypothetical protein